MEKMNQTITFKKLKIGTTREVGFSATNNAAL